MIVEKEGFGIEKVCASAVVLVVYKGSSIDFVLAEDPCGVCGETASRLYSLLESANNRLPPPCHCLPGQVLRKILAS